LKTRKLLSESSCDSLRSLNMKQFYSFFWLLFLAPENLLALEDGPPKWSKTYTVSGYLILPFAEIMEKFEAYYDEDAGKSRIDYYDGLDKTFQLANENKMVKIVPMTTETVWNQRNCFAVSGTSEEPVQVQSILPDLTGFELLGQDVKNGQTCQKWQKQDKINHKVNKYTIWLIELDNVAVPVFYEMKGFNTLLGSHYDHYYLEYANFKTDQPDAKVFEYETSKMKCHGFPGPGFDHTYTMNPMREFVHHYQLHVKEAFDDFEAKHEKSYRDQVDRWNRRDIFTQNMRFIHSKNRQHLSYTLAPNHLTDLTDSEMAMLRGKLKTTGYNGGAPFEYTPEELASTPDALDWRLFGAVTPVKDQASCGSCWSFGTVGTLEGAHFLKTGDLVRFSQQALMDCSWGFGNNACDGGEDWRVYKFLMAHDGIPTEDSYGPYLGNDAECRINDTNIEIGFQIQGYVNVTGNEATQVALAKHGPLSVSIDAGHRSLSFYSSGVYYEPECNNTIDGLDHSVLAVGYGELNGQRYWLIKNSWSTYWGNDGYVLMSQKDNNCGVATIPTFVIPKE